MDRYVGSFANIRTFWYNNNRYYHFFTQVLTLNPSTDHLIVSAQYGPSLEAPPTIIEEDETRKLMGNDNKDW